MDDSLLKARQLAEKYRAGTATEAEVRALFALVETTDEAAIKSLLMDLQLATEPLAEPDTARWDSVLQRILAARPQAAPVKRLYPWKRLAVAASIVLVLGLGWLLFRLGQPGTTAPGGLAATDIKPPAATHAVLTLGGGQKINLDDAAKGALATQGRAHIVKTDSGQIAYQPAGGAGATVVYNTLSVPRGGKVTNITLADGTIVWLNTGSSIRFPTAFTGDERTVDITGEAYFEVAHKAQQPFRVHVRDMQVEVLGTHFNINAYDDEAVVKTTLLEGKVRVAGRGPRATGNEPITLLPGEQAVATAGQAIEKRSDADLVETMAWKNGQFVFRGADITAIMKQLARWYDADIIYNGKPTDKFYAEIPRNTNASDVLKALQLTGGGHFSISGKTITVAP